ncbi:MAG: glycosyltransferase family 2 protein [Bacteroidetes bacterium]|nr:glycosyltransferase family 2 protein [Bacteroidota bacterium]
MFIRILEKLLIIYFSAYFIIDLLLYIYSLINFRKKKGSKTESFDYNSHSISIIVPAFNEAVSIVDCIKMLLEVDYVNFEVIVVNDGSKDSTLEVLKEAFNFMKEEAARDQFLTTKTIHGVFTCNQSLMLIDKDNGGKADSINAGINYSTKRYICTIDADSILDSQALKAVIEPFLLDPTNFVSGGQLAASNDVVLKHNKVETSKMPRNIWVLWQIVEYIKSFMISRIGLSKINSLLIMSGAFSVYRKEDLEKVGGFLTAHNCHPYIQKSIGLGHKTVCEDMEIVVRLWSYFRENKLKAKASFLPQPVCWTEMPESGINLYKQRSRWQMGLAETLKIHRKIAFEPAYKSTGLLAYPYYFFFELLSPIIKVFSLIFIFVAAYLGTLNLGWVLLLIATITLTTAIIMSSITVFIERWSQYKIAASRDALRYKNFGDWLWLLVVGIISDFTYAFFRTYAQIVGVLKFLQKKSDWNKFERKGVKTEET